MQLANAAREAPWRRLRMQEPPTPQQPPQRRLCGSAGPPEIWRGTQARLASIDKCPLHARRSCDRGSSQRRRSSVASSPDEPSGALPFPLLPKPPSDPRPGPRRADGLPNRLLVVAARAMNAVGGQFSGEDNPVATDPLPQGAAAHSCDESRSETNLSHTSPKLPSSPHRLFRGEALTGNRAGDCGGTNAS